jgi:ATP-binding cassette, subfamily B, bacterial PglK
VPKSYRYLLDLLHWRERRNFFLLTVLILVTSLFEVVGVAVVLPFLAVVSDPGLIESNVILSWLYIVRSPATLQKFMLELGLLVFGVILLGSLVKIGTMYAIERFSMMRGHQISSRLLELYLRQPYAWFLNQNSSQLSNSVLAEVNRAIGTVMVPAMRLISQITTLTMLVAFLIYVDPVAALGAAGIIGVFYGGVYILVQKPLKRFGGVIVESTSARYRTVGEAFHGIKEVKLFGLERLYSARYRGPSRRLALALILTRFLSEFPRFALEAVAFGGIILMVLMFLIRGDGNLDEYLPIMAMFVVAGLRILASAQQIFNALAQIRTGLPILEIVHTDFMSLRSAPELPLEVQTKRLGLTKTLELRGIVFSYPKAERRALDSVDLIVKANSIVGIVGGSGAGKSTVVDLILGLLEPEQGQILVDGQLLECRRMADWRNGIGYVSQQIYLIDDTVEANIAFGIPKECIDRNAVVRAAKLAGLHSFIIEDLKCGYDHIVGDRGVRLSGGQRQRIGIARALYHDPDVLILDEATSALDNITEAAVMDALNNLGRAKTIIMIAHRLTTIQACDNIFLMEHGRISDQGKYSDLVGRNETFRRMARETQE